MAFGATSTTKQGENNLAGGVNALQNQVYPQAISDSNSLNATGGGILGSGTNDVTAGTNFFNTLLNGNQAKQGGYFSNDQIGQAGVGLADRFQNGFGQQEYVDPAGNPNANWKNAYIPH